MSAFESVKLVSTQFMIQQVHVSLLSDIDNLGTKSWKLIAGKFMDG
jgi:hypothetical protein